MQAQNSKYPTVYLVINLIKCSIVARRVTTVIFNQDGTHNMELFN
jgi:hypothetical protein